MEPEITQQHITTELSGEQIKSTPEYRKQSISIPAAIISSAVIIALAVIFVFGPKNNIKKNTPSPSQPIEITEVPKDVAMIRPNDHIRGDITKAEIAIIEYSDSDCPFCERFHTTLQQVFSDYKGKVAWIYRYFPITSLHPNAVAEAIALECTAELGGNTSFNTYVDTIIKVTLSPDPTNKTLIDYAISQDLDATLFKTCISSTQASDRVKADTNEAQKIGAQGTPFSIIVNIKTGKQKIVPGAYPIEDVKANINALLK